MEAKHRNNEDKLSNVSGVANIEFSAHVTFFHWEDAATNFGRPCRMDKDQKLVPDCPDGVGMPEAFEPLEATLCLACARFVGVARSVALKNKTAKQYDSTTSHLAIQTSSESGQHVRWHIGL